MRERPEQMPMLEIDGSYGEGGGQVLRTSLSLSMILQQPVRIVNIRAGRKKPGLLQQHLTALNAAMQISAADVQGNFQGSGSVVFRPQTIIPGSYHFRIGTAGSALLVMQTLLPALLCADGPSVVNIEGGTHNPKAPPFHFIESVFLPQLRKMGADVTLKLKRHGFYPRGGGLVQLRVQPANLQKCDITQRGPLLERRVCAHVFNMPQAVAEAQVRSLNSVLSWKPAECTASARSGAMGKGQVCFASLRFEHVSEIASGFGMPGQKPLSVAEEIGHSIHTYLASEAPVGEFLADQLMLPYALCGKGSFVTIPLSSHSTTNLHTIELFTGYRPGIEQIAESAFLLEYRGDGFLP